MLTNEQLIQRGTMLTGRDASAIMGVSPWQTPADVWYSKVFPELTAKQEKERGGVKSWGTILEPAIMAAYEDEFKVKLEKPGTIRNPDIPWIGGTPDGIARAKKRGVECKAVFFKQDEFGPGGTDCIPDDYSIQCMHYMLVTGLKEWDLAALLTHKDISKWELRYYHLKASPALRDLAEAERLFWNEHVLKKVEPPLDYTKAITLDYLKKRYPEDDGNLITDVTTDERVVVEKFMFTRSAAAEAKKQHDMATAELRGVLKDASGISTEDLIVTCKKTKSNGVDWRAAFGDVIEFACCEDKERSGFITKHAKDGYRRINVKKLKKKVESVESFDSGFDDEEEAF